MLVLEREVVHHSVREHNIFLWEVGGLHQRIPRGITRCQGCLVDLFRHPVLGISLGIGCAGIGLAHVDDEGDVHLGVQVD